MSGKEVEIEKEVVSETQEAEEETKDSEVLSTDYAANGEALNGR